MLPSHVLRERFRAVDMDSGLEVDARIDLETVDESESNAKDLTDVISRPQGPEDSQMSPEPALAEIPEIF